MEVCRQLCCGAVTHLPHAPACRDAVCAWACAFAALSKRRMRGPSGDDGQQLAALLPPDCAAAAAASPHPPLFAANGARAALRAALGPAAVLRACAPQRQPPAAAAPGGDDAARLLLAHAAVAGPHYAAVLRTLETHVDELVGCVGGLERVRGTPLPVVYVSHLRTFLIGYLMLIPLVFLSSWRWGTVPAMALVSFALLGVEGAASECERPFDDKARARRGVGEELENGGGGRGNTQPTSS